MSKLMLDCLQSSLTVGEKFQKINEITRELTESQVDETLKVLKETPSYNIHRLKLANKFKRSSCILEILENGDKQSIAQAVKLPWMYADGSDLIDADFLVKTLFPRISYITRLKIINNLGKHLKNPQIADHIFSTIESKYGFKIASAMLQACSEEVFTNFLVGKRQHELSPSQLLDLLKKSPQVGLNYLKVLYANVEPVKEEFDSCLKYLLDHFPNEALRLMIEYPNKWYLCLGRKLFKSLRCTHRVELMKILEDKCYFLRQRGLRSFLSPEEYEKAFLKSVSSIKEYLKRHWDSDDIWGWIEYLPKSRKTALLRRSFKVVFNKEIMECPQYVTPDILLLLSAEEKSVLIDWKLENEIKNSIYCRCFEYFSCIDSNMEWFWKAMKPIKESIPELMKILNSETDYKNRSDLFAFLVMSCIFNKDTEELTNVLQLLTKKSRNDQPDLRENLLQLMNEATRHVEFEERLWACFQELFQFMQLYKEVNKNCSVVTKLLGKYAAYHQQHKKPYESELNLIVKIGLDARPYFDVSFIKEPIRQREMLEGYIQSLSATPEDSEVSSTRVHGCIIALVKEILKWNKHHQKKLSSIDVSNYPWLQRKCWEIMMEKNICNKIITFKLLKQGSGFKPDHLDKLLGKEICLPVLYYCFKRHHEKIMDNIEVIISNIVKQHTIKDVLNFILKIKATCCWTLLNKIKEECNKILSQNDPKSPVTEITNAIRLFSILEPLPQFLEFASNYYPLGAKIDLLIPIEEYRVDYAMKQSVVESLKYLPCQTSLLPVVGRFLVEDFLKFAVGSLNSICLHVPEEKALSYLQSHLKVPVILKKHIIHLFFLISPLDGKLETLEEMWSVEKHSTIRYKILVQIYRMFENEPSKEVYELLKSSLKSLTDEDKLSIDFVKENVSFDKKLDEFISDFFQTILETYKRVGLYKSIEGDTVSRFLDAVSKLDGNFLDSLIKEVLYKTRNSTEAVLYSKLAVAYLMDESASLQVQDYRMNLIHEIIQDLLDHHWDVTYIDDNNADELVFPTRRLIICILEGICDSILCSRGSDKNIVGKTIIQKFIKLLEKIKEVSEAFRSVIYMQLTLISFENTELEDSDWLNDFGRRVAAFLSLQTEKHGGEIACIINMILREVIFQMLTKMDKGNIIWIILGLLEGAPDKCQLIAAISLLPKGDKFSLMQSDTCCRSAFEIEPTIKFSPRQLQIYERVIDIIKSCSDPTVQIYFKLQQSSDKIEIFNT